MIQKLKDGRFRDSETGKIIDAAPQIKKGVGEKKISSLIKQLEALSYPDIPATVGQKKTAAIRALQNLLNAVKVGR